MVLPKTSSFTPPEKFGWCIFSKPPQKWDVWTFPDPGNKVDIFVESNPFPEVPTLSLKGKKKHHPLGTDLSFLGWQHLDWTSFFKGGALYLYTLFPDHFHRSSYRDSKINMWHRFESFPRYELGFRITHLYVNIALCAYLHIIGVCWVTTSPK